MKDFYYTYVLFSLKDGKNYAGYTKNLKLRFEQHQNGLVNSTKNRRPLKLIYFEACLSQPDALKREKYFKTYYGRMFLKNRLVNWHSEKNIS
jgi:putative endonuclease